jgi:prolyl-tRNA editing enzyme YbaK/EbsC (Cys-tRNA(Pro) deacylase)
MGEYLLSPASLEEHLEQIGARATLVPVKVETPTVDAAAQAVGTAPENIVKSLIFIAAGEPILVIAAGTKRVQVEKLAIELGIEEQKIRLA